MATVPTPPTEKAASSNPKRMEQCTVTLTKPEAGTLLGLTLDPNPVALGGVIVSAMHPAGLATSSGLIRLQDVLISINGENVNTGEQAGGLLRKAVGDITFQLHRAAKPAGAAPVPPAKPAASASSAEPEVAAPASDTASTPPKKAQLNLSQRWAAAEAAAAAAPSAEAAASPADEEAVADAADLKESKGAATKAVAKAAAKAAAARAEAKAAAAKAEAVKAAAKAKSALGRKLVSRRRKGGGTMRRKQRRPMTTTTAPRPLMPPSARSSPPPLPRQLSQLSQLRHLRQLVQQPRGRARLSQHAAGDW